MLTCIYTYKQVLVVIAVHALYSKVDDSSDELKSGPTRKKDHSAFFFPPTGDIFSLEVYTFQLKKNVKTPQKSKIH